MIRHFFKLVWNKKRRHALLIFELFLAYLITSFLVLFFFNQYHTEKQKFNIENLISLDNYNSNDTIRQNLKAIQEVKDISLTDFMPYKNRGLRGHESLQYGDKKTSAFNIWYADEHLYSTLGLTMQSGRWFMIKDKNEIKSPIVINENAKNVLFPQMEATGRIVKVGSTEHIVIGVVENLNDPSSNYSNTDIFTLDTGARFLIKLNKPIDNLIYKKIKNALSNFQNEFTENINPVEEYKDELSSKKRNITLIMCGFSGFLIVNVILGLFSILYQNINRRRPEIGLRRALGAAENDIYIQIIFEVVLLTTIALLPGVIVACQFAIFQVFGENEAYYLSMITSAFIIYILVILCALYPASLASKIQPVKALHEE